MKTNGLPGVLERLVFRRRSWVVTLFVSMTLAMAWSASRLEVDAGFSKLLPLDHEYMQTFMQYRQDFGGANRILVALMARDGDIFTPQFFDTLKQVTDEVFFIPGVDRTRVRSLFTPNVRFTEVVEDGIAGGNVIPSGFESTAAGLAEVRQNILKAGILGRLVANDFSGAIVSAELLEFDPNSGERLDYINVAEELERRIREKYQSDKIGVEIDVHIIGFAKVIGDIAAGATRVITFFLFAFLIAALLVWLYTRSLHLTLVALGCALVAVVWQLGLLPLLGFGLDPMSILVPFLVFAIALSHGVQMISAVRAEVFDGADAETAARSSFRRLLLPGFVALASDTIGFITILVINIRIIQEMAVTAGIGVAVIILTNLVLLPVLVSYLRFDPAYRQLLHQRAERYRPLWRRLAACADRRIATRVLLVAAGLLLFGLWQGSNVSIGDLHRGVPELHADSRYNVDSEVITERFSIGVDVLSVIAETHADGCVEHQVMTAIDDFAWQVENMPGVQSVITLPMIAKRINAGWNEGSLKWRVLPRNEQVMAQAIRPVDTDTGLLNADCSVMPVLIFTRDHRAETIATIIDGIKRYRQEHADGPVRFRLAGSNLGVMAATNEAVAATQFPILIYVFTAIIVLCLLTFRSWRATLCIVLPLGLVSLLAYALMALLDIGLKVNTLPVVALGVGIGVDYGLYIYARLEAQLAAGTGLVEGYRRTLEIAGNGVLFTGITLAVGVATWIFSPLKFQADMGILLTFMFLVNMLAALLLLPALAAWLLPAGQRLPEVGRMAIRGDAHDD